MTDLLRQSSALPVAAPPRLLRLELHGFKSFATRTVVRFEPGITAIVGPNGSGKSNVADAVRWVLGEQGGVALRARKTEEVIFAGGQGRAPAGMAEATLVFDNGDGWLPVAFAEVAVTRRAFRSGENHYLINDRRVRLKDVSLLTAGLGQSHLVVGQGLVDAALSQKPDERRALFEHAADLSGLRLRVAEAERNLAEAEANSVRVGDLLTDLEPRLKQLDRAARQAREWHGLRASLHDLLRAHFTQLLRHAVATQTVALAAATDAEAAVAAARATATEQATAVASGRASLELTREIRTRFDLRRDDLDERLRRVRHERDLATERAAALGRRLADMTDTQAGLDDQARSVATDLDRLRRELAALETEAATAVESARTLDTAVAVARAERQRIEREAGADLRQMQEGERRQAALQGQRALLRQRHDDAALEHQRLRATGVERDRRIASVQAEIATVDAASARDGTLLATLDDRLQRLPAEEAAAADALAAANRAAAAAERMLNEATTRLGVLRRLHEQGAGLYAGVRETLAAARAGGLDGIVGTVAELVESPAEVETAIEVALGGHLQDVVVERWRDAEAAIAHLKRGGAGRATFQPLDTVGGHRRPAPDRALALNGVHGIAADLLASRGDLRPVIDALLGRTLVVADLPTARAALPLLRTGWSAVTLGGEIARSGGSVTGGAAVRESGVLGRERELRELPDEIAGLDRALLAARAHRDDMEAISRRWAAERHAIEAERVAYLAAGEERQRQRSRLETWLADLKKDEAAAVTRSAALGNQEKTTEQEAATCDAEARNLASTLAVLAERHQDRQADDERAGATQARAEREAAAAAQQRAGRDERLRAERRRESGLRAREAALAEESALRRERAATLAAEQRTLAAAADRLTSEAATLERQRASLEAERLPLLSAVVSAETELAARERCLDESRAAVLECERSHGLAALAVERAAGDLAALSRRISDELDIVGPAAGLREESSDAAEPEIAAGSASTPVGVATRDDPAIPGDHPAIVSTLLAEIAAAETGPGDGEPLSPLPDADMREREIARLKERLRRIGYVGEEAVADFEREHERHAFLRTQLDDIQGAATALRDLLATLDATMRWRFEATVGRVADEFSGLFAALFGGGTARLELARGVDGEPGVEIVAQPPGKRLQSLALLSGGERALTAVALLFAILRINPAPFCLLDEVDAALDESNVVRFRDQLRLLASQTQTIVVTHNRGTIETADTLYGVSMGADGVSKTLSLRLSEVLEAP